MFERLIIFDVETPNRRNDKICAIGFVRVVNGVIEEPKSVLINPECEFDSMNTQIHGISERDIQNAPTFIEIWDEIKNDFLSAVVVAHNAKFDLSVLTKTLLYYGIELEPLRYIDTLAVARREMPFLTNHGLNTICAFKNIDLQHHNAESDCLACAQIICDFLRDSKLDSGDVGTYAMGAKRESVPKQKVKLSDTTQALNQLKAILEEITEDGKVEESEMSDLIDWMSNHVELSGNYPFDEIFNSLNVVLADGVISDDERTNLFVLFSQIVDPVNAVSCKCTNLEICGKNVCVTGEFNHGSRAEITEMLLQMGAVIQKSVTKKTQIVLVGDNGSDAWASGNYGTKIKKAMELQAKGVEVAIVREQEFFDVVEGK